MFFTKLRASTALAGTSLLLAGCALLVRQASADPTKAQEQQAGLTLAEFQKLKPVLDIKNELWTTLPWKYSITEARKVAAENKKLIFLNVNTGNVLGCV